MAHWSSSTTSHSVDPVPAAITPGISTTPSPKADEAIKWGYPVFEEGRILFSYAAHKAHLNFFPTGPALEPFREELAKVSFAAPRIPSSGGVSELQTDGRQAVFLLIQLG